MTSVVRTFNSLPRQSWRGAERSGIFPSFKKIVAVVENSSGLSRRRAVETLKATTEFGSGQSSEHRAQSVILGGVIGLSLFFANVAEAKLDPVNRPDLLPKEQTTVIDTGGFLTPGEEQRIRDRIQAIEEDVGVKVRLVAQNYPETPGLAVRDYWSVDEDTVVLVADPTFGGILNFNVGSNVDLQVPKSFWSRLSGKYGNKFYWQERGEGTAIINTIYAIDACLHEAPSRFQCSKIATD